MNFPYTLWKHDTRQACGITESFFPDYCQSREVLQLVEGGDGSVALERKMTFTTDKLEEVRNAVNVCTMCGFCKSVCPSFKAIGWDTALSRGRIVLTYGLLNGEIPADDSVIENMYTCTTCADCERRCPSKVKIVDIVELCRADLVKNGHMLPKHKKMVGGR